MFLPRFEKPWYDFLLPMLSGQCLSLYGFTLVFDKDGFSSVLGEGKQLLNSIPFPLFYLVECLSLSTQLQEKVLILPSP